MTAHLFWVFERITAAPTQRLLMPLGAGPHGLAERVRLDVCHAATLRPPVISPSSPQTADAEVPLY